MKRIITYSLLFLALTAFNYEAFDYFFKVNSRSIVCLPDCDCEEEQGSEKSNEKKDIAEYLFFINLYKLSPQVQLLLKQQSKLLFVSSDYSMAVYSPPEKAVI